MPFTLLRSVYDRFCFSKLDKVNQKLCSYYKTILTFHISTLIFERRRNVNVSDRYYQFQTLMILETNKSYFINSQPFDYNTKNWEVHVGQKDTIALLISS